MSTARSYKKEYDKVLITGHKGFIGSALWKTFLDQGRTEGVDLFGIDIKDGLNGKIYKEHDILTADLPEADLVIHLAGIGGVRESLANPKKYWLNNVKGTRRILEHYKDSRVLVASSSSQYEPHLNPYAASKHLIERIPHPHACFLRFHTVYSDAARTGMFFDKLFAGTLEYVTEHERDFIHLDDMVAALHAIINNDLLAHTFDIGTGQTICIKDIISWKEMPVKKDTLGERQKTQADIDFITKATDWKPTISVRDFLQENDERLRNLYPVK